MRTSAAALAAVLTFAPVPHHAAAAITPCTKATVACERWIAFGGGPARSMVYASYALDAPNPADHPRAHHGARRRTKRRPLLRDEHRRRLSRRRTRQHDHHRAALRGRTTSRAERILWPERGSTWRSGGMSPSNPTLSSFDFVDEIVRKLADKKIFPNLTKSRHRGPFGRRSVRDALRDGEQDARHARRRDELRRRESVELRVARRGAAAPHRRRRSRDADKEALGEDGEKVHTAFTYGPFDATKAPDFNRWPAGLENRTGYAAGMSDDATQKAARRAADDLPARPGGRASARWIRFVTERDGAGPDAPSARRSVLQVRQRFARREAKRHHRPGVRAQRPVHLHDRLVFPAIFPK